MCSVEAMDRSLGIVVPAYRPDVDLLATYVRSLDESLAPAALRIELDAPRPGVVDALAALPATVNAVPERRGKGAAVTAGFEALETDVLAFVDADGSTPVESVTEVVAPPLAGETDLAVGSRRHPDSEVRSHQTLARRRLGDAFAWVARRLLDADLHDFQCGAKALTRETWDAVRSHLYEPGFAWDVELVAMTAALDRRIVEVPIVWEDRPGSTVSPLSTAVSMGQGLLVARHRARRLGDSRLHGAIAARREEPPALVDRERGG
jgi:glycosyltransferase involved in cell wall biosynthesis